jgi:hypothetical protein
VDIWLLTNIPIQALPPTHLLTMREVLQAPEGVNVFKWGRLTDFLEGRENITAADIMEQLDVNYETARGYLGKIAQLPGWELAAIKSQRGKPTKLARRAIIAENTIN